MKKFLTILFISFFSSVSVLAENAGGQQTIQLSLQPVIEISSNIQANINAKGSLQAFAVKANKGFNITASTVNTNQKVKIAVVENNTNGTAVKNATVSTTAQEIIKNCSLGNEQTFAVNYGSNAQGLVIYTATQR